MEKSVRKTRTPLAVFHGPVLIHVTSHHTLRVRSAVGLGSHLPGGSVICASPRGPRRSNSMSHRRDAGPIDCKVYVGDLGQSGTKHELERAFGAFGPLRNVWVARNPAGFAFVEFEDPRDARDAVDSLDGRYICGRRVLVELSHGKKRSSRYRPAAPPSYRGGGSSNYDYPQRRRSRSFSPAPRRRQSSRSRSRSPRDRSPRDRSPRDSRRRSRSRSRSRDRKHSRSRSRDRSRSVSPLNKSPRGKSPGDD
ncbi:serine/arginine-rich splicing factor 3-like isoform X2 [Branchiostoma lanceolatum]|uniref:serine/arginine-rich splicing factor 3-like isoform X2 n=1 Tax=Branchiostoma lanceolatum TaxID=7740 RepID=UPI0034513F17